MANCIPTLKIRDKIFTGAPVSDDASLYDIVESVLKANQGSINKLLFEQIDPSELTDYKDIIKLAGNTDFSSLIKNLRIHSSFISASIEALLSFLPKIKIYNPKILLVDGDIKLNGVSVPSINIGSNLDLIILSSTDPYTIYSVFQEYIWRKNASSNVTVLPVVSKEWSNKYDSETCYEVSTSVENKGYKGDARFSAFHAKFNDAVKLPNGIQIYKGVTIEDAYQKVIKKSGKGRAPDPASILNYGNIKPFSMYFSYIVNNKVMKRDDVTANSTFDAIINGERTSTTRYNTEHADAWRALKPGQVIKLYNTAKQLNANRYIYVQIESITNIDKDKEWTDKELEEWSQNEGWSFEYAKNLMVNNMRTKNGGVIVRYKFLYEEDQSLSQKEKEEELSYQIGYLPLWEAWVKQHLKEFYQLIKDSDGKILSDEHSGTRVSLARALAEIISKTDTSLIDFVLHSGGANGSDHEWDIIGREFGLVETKHYYWEGEDPKLHPPYRNTGISDDDYNEGRKKAALAALRNYIYNYDYVNNPLLARNWAQVKYSSSIFAIGKIAQEGEDLFPDEKVDSPEKIRYAKTLAVTGGTGYAVSIAINEGNNDPKARRNIYVFDQNKKHWYFWDWDSQTFLEYNSTPILTKDFAGIGTRKINEDGKNAIREVYAKTVLYLKNPEIDQVRPIDLVVGRVNEILLKEKENNIRLKELFATEYNVWDIICRNSTFNEILDRPYNNEITNRDYLTSLLDSNLRNISSENVGEVFLSWISQDDSGTFIIKNSNGELLQFVSEEDLVDQLHNIFNFTEEESLQIAQTIFTGKGQNGKIEDMLKYIDEIINEC